MLVPRAREVVALRLERLLELARLVELLRQLRLLEGLSLELLLQLAPARIRRLELALEEPRRLPRLVGGLLSRGALGFGGFGPGHGRHGARGRLRARRLGSCSRRPAALRRERRSVHERLAALELRAQGSLAYGSHPPLGQCAALKLVRFLPELSQCCRMRLLEPFDALRLLQLVRELA